MGLAGNNFSNDPHGWAELLPKRQAAPSFSENQRVPWVVIGAGVTGLACARRLAELHPDDEILLLEARLVGQGASGRNSGFAVAVSHFTGGFKTDHMEDYRRVNRINKNGLDLLAAQVEAHAIECQWKASGFHHTAADQHSLREYAHFLHYLEAMEITHMPLDQDNLEQRLGTRLYRRGVHVPDGVLLQPAALVRGLADSLPANVRLIEDTPVLKIDTGRPLTLQLEKTQVKTDKLILATNYEAGKLGILQRYIVGSTLSGSLTRILNQDELASLGSLNEWGVLSLHGGGATVRLSADHRLCVRNTAEYHGADLLSDALLKQRQKIHRAGFDKRFLQLAHVPFEYAWSGVEGISRNGTNFFGRRSDNIFLAGGYNGSGLSRGITFGSCLAEYASDGHSALIDDCLACAPAKWIPPRPFLDIGAFVTVRSRFIGVGRDR
jgi:glycine/D-amino acid oxidase-like deaminating enzyme